MPRVGIGSRVQFKVARRVTWFQFDRKKQSIKDKSPNKERCNTRVKVDRELMTTNKGLIRPTTHTQSNNNKQHGRERREAGDTKDKCSSQPARANKRSASCSIIVEHRKDIPYEDPEQASSPQDLSPGELIPRTTGCLGGDLESPAATSWI